MRHSITFYHLFFALILLGCLATLLLTVPPEHPGVIVLFIALATFTVFYLTALITPNKNTRVLAAALVGIFFGMNALIGFNLLNTILLISFIIGLKLLLR